MNRVFLLVLTAGLVLLLSCATVDHGLYKADGLSAEQKVELYISGFVQVTEFDAEPVSWLSGFNIEHKVIIPPGTHVMLVHYFKNNAQYGSLTSGNALVKFEAGPGLIYRINAEVSGARVHFAVELYTPTTK